MDLVVEEGGLQSRLVAGIGFGVRRGERRVEHRRTALNCRPPEPARDARIDADVRLDAVEQAGIEARLRGGQLDVSRARKGRDVGNGVRRLEQRGLLAVGRHTNPARQRQRVGQLIARLAEPRP